jgi:hypothetical protein
VKLFNKRSELNAQMGPVTFICNPSYSGGRYQEDFSLKPAWAKKEESSSKKSNTRKQLVECSLEIELLPRSVKCEASQCEV